MRILKALWRVALQADDANLQELRSAWAALRGKS